MIQKTQNLLCWAKYLKLSILKKFKDTCNRKGINNRQMMVDSIKILFISMYFDYTVSNVVNELNRSVKLRKFAGFSKKKYQQQNRSMNTWADILQYNTAK